MNETTERPISQFTTSVEDEFGNELENKEKAIILFLKNVANLESNDNNEDGRRWEINWQNGSTQNLPDKNFIPVPYGEFYEVFTWMRVPLYPTGANDQIMRQINTNVETLGSSDIRIIDADDSLLFTANIGALEGTQDWWEETVGAIKYPIKVTDRHGFLYTNKAFQE